MHACAECGDTGWRPLTEDEKVEHGYPPGVAVSTECTYCVTLRIERQTAELQEVSQLSEAEKLIRLDDIVTEDRADTSVVVKACREMLAGNASMLTIWGTNGNGKSDGLIAMVNEFLDRGIPALYVPSYDLLNWLQDAFNSKGEVKDESMFARLERVKFIRVLAVDEFQGIKVTDWRLEQLRNIVDRRWRDGVDGKSFSLFAMNEDPASLEPRIWSRLRDGRNVSSGSPVIENNDSDMRPLLRRKR
jgi:DNA replication protein DnaC